MFQIMTYYFQDYHDFYREMLGQTQLDVELFLFDFLLLILIIQNTIISISKYSKDLMITSGRQEQIIQYEKDPSNSSDVNIQYMYGKLDSYSQINKTKKTTQKKNKKGILKSAEVNKQKKNEASNFTNILKKVRKDSIVQQFINKLKLNITLNSLNARDQIQYFSIGQTSFQQDFRKKLRLGKIRKLFQNQNLQFIIIIIKFFAILGIFYINSLKIAFDELHSLDNILTTLIIFTISFFLMQLTAMIIVIVNWKITFWKNFLYWIEKQQLVWEICITVGIFLELIGFPFINSILIIFLIKQVFILMNKFKRIQNSFVLSINFQRYWELMKIILFNFCIAHFLSIILNLMGSIQVQGSKNWYTQKKIQPDADWVVKYIWGYYWGTTIMLTVGFGDISAENHIQALFLVFIQTFACMIMAYNVSEVSKILQDISQMDQQKKLKFKVFNQMSQKYNFQQNFKSNVFNHIDKSVEKKHQLTYIEQSLIQELPQKIKLQVKREINKNVFKQAYFFKNLTKKTQNLLAQKVNKIFAHPEQIILKNMQTWKILILRQGNVALTFKKGNSVNNGTIIEQFSVQQITKPQLLSLKFIRKSKIKGDLKSLDFSILNALQIQNFQKILKQHDAHMFEFYCSQRDKTQYHQFDLQIKKCTICTNSKHDKIQCPRMHFIPLKQHIIYKKKFMQKGSKLIRMNVSIERRKKPKLNNSLKIYHLYGKDQTIIRTRNRAYSQIIPSLQLIGSAITENLQLSKKIDKCLQKLDLNLKLIKGEVNSEQLIVDKAQNYKRYFPKHNPDNLMFFFMQQKGKKLNITQKKIHLNIL